MEFLQQDLQTQKRAYQYFGGTGIACCMKGPRSVGCGQSNLGPLEAGFPKDQGRISNLKAGCYQPFAFSRRDKPLLGQGQAVFGGKDGSKTMNSGMKARTNGRGRSQDIQNDNPRVLDNGRPQLFGGEGYLQQKTLIRHSRAFMILGRG